MKKRVFTVPLVIVLVLGAALVVYAVSEGQLKEIGDLPYTLQQLFTRKATIFGEVREEAVAPETVTAAVSVGGKSSRVNSKGEYEIKDVSPGLRTLRVESSDHETFEKEVEIVKGRNRADIPISLTPEETLRRWFDAYKQEKYDEAYEYVHPEDKAQVSEDEYVEFFKNFINSRKLKIVSVDVGKAKMLDKWTNTATQKVYPGIAEIETTVIFSSTASGSAKQSEEKVTMHLAKTDRQWKGFWTKP